MKRLLSATALTLTLAIGACSTAGLSANEEAMVESNDMMTDVMKAEIDGMNELTSIYIDAAALYKQAADIPDENNGLKPILMDLAEKRQSDREMLQERVIALGGKPDEAGEAIGTGHRAFTALRTVVDDDTEVAVEEVLRGERYIVEEINEYWPSIKSAESRALLTQLKADAEVQIGRLEALDSAL